MSADRFTEMLNYLSAMSRDMGEFRAEVKASLSEMKASLSEVNSRLDRIEREQRSQVQRLDRIEGFLLITRSDIGALQDRVDALEGRRD